MLQVSRRPALTLLLAALALLAAGQNARAQNDPDKAKEEPPFHAYKGVRIGMTADEARKLLGNPTDKDDKQDFYSFNDKESCQVYYDDTKKVFAVSVTYLATDGVPAAKSILGADADAKQDGSLYKMLRFPKVGYWVSYTRTSGDAPMTIIAMQKIQ
jgi:HJR/Mrr/RecB family endonuclease